MRFDLRPEGRVIDPLAIDVEEIPKRPVHEPPRGAHGIIIVRAALRGRVPTLQDHRRAAAWRLAIIAARPMPLDHGAAGGTVQRDNQDENPYCLSRKCSRTLVCCLIINAPGRRRIQPYFSVSSPKQAAREARFPLRRSERAAGVPLVFHESAGSLFSKCLRSGQDSSAWLVDPRTRLWAACRRRTFSRRCSVRRWPSR